MKNKIRIYSKEDNFTLSDLSELFYNINNIYKLLIFDKKKEEKRKKYYYLQKLSDDESLFVEEISKKSPFYLQLSVSDVIGVIGIFIGVLNIAMVLRNLVDERGYNRREIKEIVVEEFGRENIRFSEELVRETIKLSKRRIKIERIEEN